jgi:hypothetical protein
MLGEKISQLHPQLQPQPQARNDNGRQGNKRLIKSKRVRLYPKGRKGGGTKERGRVGNGKWKPCSGGVDDEINTESGRRLNNCPSEP